jgi:phosphatidylethanolamine/phosphatidyl-N-methylethanolamine N-methyltransferase
MQDRKPADAPPTNVGPEAWTFFRQWLRNPLRIAALSPSSRHLARRMVRQLDGDVERVVELGAGTGVFTRELIAHGIAPENLMVVELTESLYHHLHRQFPNAQVVHGDARHLPELARANGFTDKGPVDAVVSGLGLLSMSLGLQREILSAAFEVLKPEGRLVQFTYGPANPVKREIMNELGLQSRRSAFSLWNLPPATVYVISRARSKAIKAVKPPGSAGAEG